MQRRRQRGTYTMIIFISQTDGPVSRKHLLKMYLELEGTHRVQTHAVLLLNLNLILTLTFQPRTIQVIPYTKFEHCDHSVLNYALDISMKMHLLTLWPWPLTFQSLNHIISVVSQDHFLYQVGILWDHSLLSWLRTNKQTDRRTEGPKCPIPRRPTVCTIQYNTIKYLYSAYSHRVSRALRRRELISNVQKSRFWDSAWTNHGIMCGL